MIFKLYAVKDKKSDFAAPVPIQDDAQAKRWFDNEIKTKPFLMEYAEDFDLYRIGTFDAETAQVTSEEFPVFILSAEEVKISVRTEETIQNNS